MLEFISIFVYGLVAFLLPIAMVVTLAAALHWGQRRENGLMPYLFYPVLLIVAVTILLSGRNLYLISDFAQMVLVKHPIATWISRLTSVSLLVIASERILRRFFVLAPSENALKPLVIAFCFYCFTNVFTSALLAEHTSFSHDYFYMAIAGVAVLFASRRDGDVAVISARNALFCLLVFSALCILVKPELVLSRDYQGYIPGLRYRYAGLSNHANAFGPLVVVFLMCLWIQPFKRAWLTNFSWMLGAFSLLLAQSKTSWIAFILCFICLAYFGHREFLKQRLFDFKRPNFLIGILLLLMLAAMALFILIMFGSVGDKLNSYLVSRAGNDLVSMTGRNQIWDVAIQEWRKYPIFGYGLSIWNEDFRAQIGLPAAYHAHNQFFQSLASAGLVGVVGLITYAVILFRYTLKTAESSKGLSVALYVMIFARSISEVPLAMNSFGPEQIVHLLLLMVIVANTSIYQASVKVKNISHNLLLTPSRICR
jgi:exopolysaccharide production protein ExoQ